MSLDQFYRTYSPRQPASARYPNQRSMPQRAPAPMPAPAPTPSPSPAPAPARDGSNDILVAYRINEQPYYRPVADEVELYEAAYLVRMPMMLKGPTGCGKTRFVEYMAWKLGKPLITVACNEDMTASDLVGRFLLDANGTRWQDGPLALAARHGGICYLDEIVEARQDTTVVIHPLTDARRILPLDKKGEVVHAHPDFQVVISYNPGYQSLMKDLKQSTKQRFGGLDFNYPEQEVEAEIVAHESGIGRDLAIKLVQIAERARNLKGHGLDEGISTRMLIYAGSLIQRGVDPLAACRVALVRPITDDPDMRNALDSAVTTYL
jgi:nitric oxide reductase NorQ protein